MGFKLGHQGYLYWGNAPLDPGTVDVDTAGQWTTGDAFELEMISGDVATGGSPVEVDTTTMATMRQAKTGSIEVATSGEISFDIQVDLLSVTAIRTIVEANRDKTTMSLLYLIGELTENGAWGTAANYTLSFDQNRPLQGVQTMQMRFKLLDNLQWVEISGGVPIIVP